MTLMFACHGGFTRPTVSAVLRACGAVLVHFDLVISVLLCLCLIVFVICLAFIYHSLLYIYLYIFQL